MTMHDPAAQPPCTLDAPAAVEIAVQTLYAPKNAGDWDGIAALLRRIAAGKGTPVSDSGLHSCRNGANTRAVIAQDRGEGGPLCVRALACRHGVKDADECAVALAYDKRELGWTASRPRVCEWPELARHMRGNDADVRRRLKSAGVGVGHAVPIVDGASEVLQVFRRLGATVFLRVLRVSDRAVFAVYFTLGSSDRFLLELTSVPWRVNAALEEFACEVQPALDRLNVIEPNVGPAASTPGSG